MVTRVLHLLYREVRGLHQAAYVLALFTLASQILAIVRDRLLASQFGAGYELDIYYTAFRIPDLLFVLFASVLSVYVLLPFVARAEETQPNTGRQVLSQVYSLFLLGYTLIAAVTFATAGFLVPWLFPGFNPEAYSEIVMVLRILLLQPLLLGISSLFGVVTQMNHRFVLYALSPLLYNIGIIFGIAVLFPLFGIAGLAYGVVLGALGHMLVQWPLVRTSPLHFSFVRTFDWPALWSIAKVAIPRALTLSLGQLQMIALVAIASTMTIGSVAVLQLALNLQAVPLAIVGMSYSVAAFPVLTELLAKRDTAKFNAYVLTALRHIIFWSLPIIALVIVLRAQMVRVLLGGGSFNWDDTRLTAAALGIFIITLAAQSLLLLLVRAFYAGGKTRIPLLLTALGVTVGTTIAYVLYQVYQTNSWFAEAITAFLRLDTVAGVEVLMLPLGYACGVLVELIVMLIVFTYTYNFPVRALWRPFWQGLSAACAGGLAAYLTLAFVVEGVNQNTFIGIFIQGIAGGLLGVSAVLVVYAVLDSVELHELTKSFRTRLFKTDVVAPQPDII
jgi:putative peptidoglycan lipid II flippase